MDDYKTVKNFQTEAAINWDRKPQAIQNVEKTDTKFVKTLLACGRYIGVTPLNTGEVARVCIKILTLAILLTMFIYQSMSMIYIAAVYNSKHYIITHALTNGLWGLSEYLFIAACFLSSNIYRQEKWKITFQLFDQMEMLLLQYKIEVKKSLFFFYIEIVFIYTICISLHCFDSCNLKSLGWNPLYFIGWRMAHLYMIFFLILFVNLTHLLKRRYNVLNKQVESLLNNRNDFIIKLKEVVKLYKLLGNLVEQINIIFGPHIYLFVQVSIAAILFAVIDILVGKDNDLGASSATKRQFAMAIIFPLIYIVSKNTYPCLFRTDYNFLNNLKHVSVLFL